MSEIKQFRRLQVTGGSTYTVSLPKTWIDELGLKKNSNVTLIKNRNDSITLFQEEQSKKTNAIALIGKKDTKESLRRKIIAIYLSGYKTIEIKTKGIEITSGHRGAIRDLVRTTLMGTEIIEASSEKIVLQVLTQLAQLSFDVALKRMYITATNMHQDAIEALKELDVEQSEEVLKMDDEVDRFSLYLMRNLNLSLENVQVLLDSGLEKPSDCLGYRTVVKCVERIADHAGLIAKKVKYLNSPIDKKILKEIDNISKESLTVFENSVSALSKRDYEMAEKVASSVTKVIEKEKSLMDSLKPSDNIAIIKLILEDIRRTAEYSRDISEIAIDETVQSVIEES
ncbi:phosphate uptake regulator PhoU [Nitrosopumilus sp.]|uniref:phosphate signaling complex PhoU family protein n=1 Tax=Nitrosopumilus sp. TaxID=2024843 RepID=UPI00247CFA4D|nr:phosphate uptake regulator PhoU [Nitrosopumilus sp.]MCV0430439.1 phosphate uptake regulator PhoU [Nitrosopumilus sp.]